MTHVYAFACLCASLCGSMHRVSLIKCNTLFPSYLAFHAHAHPAALTDAHTLRDEHTSARRKLLERRPRAARGCQGLPGDARGYQGSPGWMRPQDARQLVFAQEPAGAGRLPRFSRDEKSSSLGLCLGGGGAGQQPHEEPRLLRRHSRWLDCRQGYRENSFVWLQTH